MIEKPRWKDCSPFNGYSSYETWQVGCFIDNDESSYNAVTRRVERLFEQNGIGHKEFIKTVLTRHLRANYNHVVKVGKRKINWEELAQEYIDAYLEGHNEI